MRRPGERLCSGAEARGWRSRARRTHGAQRPTSTVLGIASATLRWATCEELERVLLAWPIEATGARRCVFRPDACSGARVLKVRLPVRRADAPRGGARWRARRDPAAARVSRGCPFSFGIGSSGSVSPHESSYILLDVKVADAAGATACRLSAAAGPDLILLTPYLVTGWAGSATAGSPGRVAGRAAEFPTPARRCSSSPLWCRALASRWDFSPHRMLSGRRGALD